MTDFLRSGAIISLSHHRLLIAWGEERTLTKAEIDPVSPAFYLSDFFLTTPRPWRQYPYWLEISHEEFKHHFISSSSLSTCYWTIRNPEQFKKAFTELSHDLNRKMLKKAVPYLFAFSSNLMTPDRLQNSLKHALISLEQKPGYLYGHWNQAGGVMGVTPELLFSHSQQEPKKVYTMALAGTCHPSKCHNAFIKDQKEQHEHQLVIQGISQSLQKLGSMTSGPLQLLRLSHLTHLMTPLEVKLKQPFHFETIVHCLHPTPALGTFPKIQGKKWLENYDKHTPRQFYGTPIGFQYPKLGISQCLISIRNVQWDPAGMLIGAGCGVVKRSQFDKEWLEILFKIRAIRNQLSL